jgi:hypothetical protein
MGLKSDGRKGGGHRSRTRYLVRGVQKTIGANGMVAASTTSQGTIVT